MMEALSFSEVATVCINHTNHCSCLVNEKIIINKIMMKIYGKILVQNQKVGSYKNGCYLVFYGKINGYKESSF